MTSARLPKSDSKSCYVKANSHEGEESPQPGELPSRSTEEESRQERPMSQNVNRKNFLLFLDEVKDFACSLTGGLLTILRLKTTTNIRNLRLGRPIKP